MLSFLELLLLLFEGFLLFNEEVAGELAASVGLESAALQLDLAVSQLAISIQSLAQINEPLKTALIPALCETFTVFAMLLL